LAKNELRGTSPIHNVELGRTPLRYELARLVLRNLPQISPVWLALGEGPRWLKGRLWFPEPEALSEPFDATFRQVIEKHKDELRTLTGPPALQRLPLEWIATQRLHLSLFREELQGMEKQLREEEKAVDLWEMNAAESVKKHMLTHASSCDIIGGVKQTLGNTLKRANRLVETKGKMTELADFLGAPLASVSRWLAGTRQPSGDFAIRLLDWVEREEGKSK